MNKIIARDLLYFIGFLALLFLAFHFAFSKTISAKRKVESMNEASIKTKNLVQESSLLQLKKSQIDSLIKNYNLDIDFSERRLLMLINEYKDGNKLKTISFKNPNIFTDTNNTTFSTYQIVVSGTFQEISELVYILEHKKRIGKVTSLNIEKHKKLNTIIGTLYIERISSI